MLNKEQLIKEIRKLNDSSFEEFIGFPNSCPLATSKWVEAFYIYAKDIIPISNTVTLAKSQCQQVLLGICSSSSFGQSVTIFTNAIMAFAQGIIPGFISSSFTGVMPSSYLNLIPIFTKANNGGSAYDFAVELSEAIDNWFKSGTAININSGVTINWM